MAETNGIAVKRKPFAKQKRGEGTMQCTRRRKTKSDVNPVHGHECVLSAMIDSMRITSMMVMEKHDYQHVIRRKTNTGWLNATNCGQRSKVE